MKKYNYMLFSTVLFLSNGMCAEYRQLDKEKINVKSIAIKQMIARHNYATGFLAAAGYIQNLSFAAHGLVTCMNYWKGNNVAQGTKKNVNNTSTTFIDSIRGMGTDAYNLFFTGDGWWRIAQQLFIAGGYTGSMFIMYKVADAVEHPDTLRWYISAKTPYVATIRIMQQLVKKLEMGIANTEMLDYYKTSLRAANCQLIEYGEGLCAYMQYKSEILEAENQKDAAERVSRYLFTYQNACLDAIFAELDKNEPEYQKISQLLTNYETELKFQCAMFFVIEGETKRDRKAAYG